jgi:hypothetical protein
MSTLVINAALTPIVRAGRANLVFPVLVMGAIVVWQVAQLEGPARYVIGGLLLFWMAVGIHAYLTTLVRMEFAETAVDIVFPVHRTRINYATIEKVKVVRYSLTPLLRLRMRSKGRMPVRVTIQGPFTPWGSLQECANRLGEEFARRGVQVT